MKNLASFLRGEGRKDEAEQFCRRALGLDRKHAPNHPRQIGGAGNLALLMREHGDADGASQMLSKLIVTAKSPPEADRLGWAKHLAALGANAAQFGHWDEADRLFRAADECGSDTSRLPAFRVIVASQRRDAAVIRPALAAYIAGVGKDGQTALSIDLAPCSRAGPPKAMPSSAASGLIRRSCKRPFAKPGR
jgi:hypothetical protein